MTKTDGVETLYPFLYGDGDGADVAADLRRSTAEKALEIVALRRALAGSHAEALAACAGRLAAAFRAGGRLLAFGNGGSSTDAQSLARLFMSPPPPARPLPALSLSQDVAAVTALSNDVGFEVALARQVAALGRPGDVAVALSTSGGSANVLNALAEASRRGLVTVGLAGYDGGEMARAQAVEHLFVVPSASVHRIQEAQSTLVHVLWELVQRALEGGAAAC
ncbi:MULTISPECIES: D-sedoheptulose-7-phosphate isomerase [Thermomonospora]|uniref:Putative sedoheptulose 7-phosphate isomerase n=1 Tax=Thermomonospora curvata (strain ATCC 19995 / DSM 43183 / JCM 3096 / KCTC 9072 / NBRC 15933 / NCIMB 10081 / Henssen B9) TaxID=471852 RepID=D1A5B9_THECD|nr:MULTISPECIES: SIS domain-containing protein [Thermomonospora]ACZ00105.1 putative sedoheptulose 7-phosphate isomerase [Thermomonospora curvata DSM 43183]PKK11932.1 MAG: SIS domain-containing protein [Thermomonospora sp. CIF 1]